MSSEMGKRVVSYLPKFSTLLISEQDNNRIGIYNARFWFLKCQRLGITLVLNYVVLVRSFQCKVRLNLKNLHAYVPHASWFSFWLSKPIIQPTQLFSWDVATIFGMVHCACAVQRQSKAQLPGYPGS